MVTLKSNEVLASQQEHDYHQKQSSILNSSSVFKFY